MILKRKDNSYSDILRMFPFGYSNHPQEFINVISRVTDHSAENYQHVVNI